MFTTKTRRHEAYEVFLDWIIRVLIQSKLLSFVLFVSSWLKKSGYGKDDAFRTGGELDKARFNVSHESLAQW